MTAPSAVQKARRAAKAIYIACPKEVADDVAALLTILAARVEALEAANALAVEALGSYGYTHDEASRMLSGFAATGAEVCECSICDTKRTALAALRAAGGEGEA